jgi:hypothetical protein
MPFGSMDTLSLPPAPAISIPGQTRNVSADFLQGAGNAIVVFSAQAVLVCLVFLIPQDILKLHVHYFYLVHYLLFLPFFITARDRCAFLFSPSFLVITYVCISFVLGGFAFSKGYVLLPRNLVDFHRWSQFNAATAYFLACDILAAVAYFLARRRETGLSLCFRGRSLGLYTPQLIAGGILFLVFSSVSIGLGMLGGNGDFSIGPRTFGFLVVSVVLTKARWRYRFLAYVGLLMLLAASEYDDRRVVLLLALSVIFMEVAHLPHVRLSFRHALVCAIVLAVAVVFQMTMTIARGLEGFQGPYWQTFGQLDRFVSVKNAAAYSLKQTEGPTTFFHSNNAIGYVLDDPSLLRYGSTLAKTLFILVPRPLWPEKPKSMVDIYTYRWNPTWRMRGCSTGINVYAEYFWNFHVFGILCILPIFYFFNRAFFFYLHRLRAGDVWPYVYIGVGYNSLLMYARGHGLHSLAIDVVFALGIQVLLFQPLVAVLSAAKRRELSHEALCVHKRSGPDDR